MLTLPIGMADTGKLASSVFILQVANSVETITEDEAVSVIVTVLGLLRYEQTKFQEPSAAQTDGTCQGQYQDGSEDTGEEPHVSAFWWSLRQFNRESKDHILPMFNLGVRNMSTHP